MTTPYPCRVDSATIAPRPTGRAKLASDDFPVFHGCSCELGTRNSTFKTKLIFDPMFQLPKSKRSFRSCLVARRSRDGDIIRRRYANLLCIHETASTYDGSDPNGIRTRVTAVKGRCPGPLDDRVGRAPNYQDADCRCKSAFAF